jgi:hypothetical protein
LQRLVAFGNVIHETPNCNKGVEDCSSCGHLKLMVEHNKMLGWEAVRGLRTPQERNWWSSAKIRGATRALCAFLLQPQKLI